MKSSVSILMLVFALVLTSLSMEASVITSFDQNLPGSTGFYNGTGNVDGDFVNMLADYGSGNTITASLRLAQRTVGPIAPSIDNNYNCQAAEQCNVEYSVYTTGFHLADFTYALTIDDVTTGHSLSFDPLNTIPDDSYWTADSGGSKTLVKNTATEVGFQNSEYLGFSFISMPLGGWTPTDQLIVTLAVTPVSGVSLDPQVQMTVNQSAVPEPASVGLIGFGLMSLGLMRRRISSSKA